MLQLRFYQFLLQPGEKVLLVTDQHWTKRLVAHYAICTGTLLLSLGIYFWLGPNSWWTIFTTVGLVLWGSGVIASYFLIWGVILQRRGLVLTTHRILYFSHDILTRSHFIIPYQRIEESTIKENFFSHLFGYGTWYLIVHENKEQISFIGYDHIQAIEKIINRYITLSTPDSKFLNVPVY